MENKCNHILGHGYEDEWDGFVYLRKEESKHEDNNISELLEYMKPWLKDDLKFSRENKTLMLHSLQNIKTEYDMMIYYISLFNYCPRCGEHIDWSKYKRQNI